MGQECPAYWHDIKQNFLLEVKQLWTKPWVWSTRLRLSEQQRKRKQRCFCPRSYMPEQRPYYWVVRCTWWCRSWKGVMDPILPHGLSVTNTYTEMTTGSKWVAVVVKNLTATLITITKGVKVTQVVATNVVSQVEVVSGTIGEVRWDSGYPAN